MPFLAPVAAGIGALASAVVPTMTTIMGLSQGRPHAPSADILGAGSTPDLPPVPGQAMSPLASFPTSPAPQQQPNQLPDVLSQMGGQGY